MRTPEKEKLTLLEVVKHPEKYIDKKKVLAMKLIMLNSVFLINALSKNQPKADQPLAEK